MCYLFLVLYHVTYSLEAWATHIFLNFRQQDCGLRRQAPHKRPSSPRCCQMPNDMHVITLYPRNLLQLQRLSSDGERSANQCPE
ncbi:uncharacterized protein PgNI_01553 [Pyricularia grisea]|uniref:Secreted protein n=1 Tax=Pyricularia grisea TaxID=148305 RepID=A0A6P8BHM6_PYRGI|nr:uncharacterized protein PgNI_01553 [Pyricularia grisea]TLD16114.1 hypothetical protein PgNI_01553 [Pyricularia grisea]